jgi:hypothetical protein
MHPSTSISLFASYATYALMERRKLKLKPKGFKQFLMFSFKRSLPGAFNVGLICSSFTVLP